MKIITGNEQMVTYTPCIEVRDNVHTDMLIEDMLNHIYQDYYDAELFNEIYTGIVQTHIDENCPFLVADHAGKNRAQTGAVHYLAMLRLDYVVISHTGPLWPPGGFEFMPDAVCAVAIFYHDGVSLSDYAPGKSINQATLASLIQMSREISQLHYNQPELDLQPYDA